MLSPSVVRWSRDLRWRRLRVRQRITRIDCRNLERLRTAVDQGKGVLIVPNHSAHYDSAALYVAADRIRQPLYFMTAWQVFAMSSPWERWLMQRLGCFSINREGYDRQAFKQAVRILQHAPHPLVIFPEGDIYHTNDYVTPFREGAAAIALSASRLGDRPIVIIPCGIKFWYEDDPTPCLLNVSAQIEQRLYLRSWPQDPLPERIHRIAEAALALKELDYLGHTQAGSVRVRIAHLSQWILGDLEQRHAAAAANATPERVKALRQHIIQQIEECEKNGSAEQGLLQQLGRDMEDLFFVMQLYSYRGDYLLANPSKERIAETVDKFEEDILARDLPGVRGRRRVMIDFGQPIEAPRGKQPRDRVEQLTAEMQQAVQAIIDRFNLGEESC